MQLDNPKLMSLSRAAAVREGLKQQGKSLVLTNGCFDLLHTGHLYFLRQAREQGEALWIAINSDESVRQLKGATRPIQGEQERAYALAALSFVDGIFIFREPRLTAEIRAVAPDVYVKAGDYTLDTLNAEERAALEEGGASIRFLPFLPGFSTTALIEKIRAAAEQGAL